jgi:hypothetical protein
MLQTRYVNLWLAYFVLSMLFCELIDENKLMAP